MFSERDFLLSYELRLVGVELILECRTFLLIAGFIVRLLE